MRGDAVMQVKRFTEINLADSFFDTLKEAYSEFSDWFLRKANEPAYVTYDIEGNLQGFLYIKGENGPISDITPPLNAQRILKVGTFKVTPHGTRMGERFVKKIFDFALEWQVSHLYVTVFPKHTDLINLLETYGFRFYGRKKSTNGEEHVFLKDFVTLSGDLNFDYPIVHAHQQKWLLSISPMYHTKLFPDSILRTESNKIMIFPIQTVFIKYMSGRLMILIKCGLEM